MMFFGIFAFAACTSFGFVQGVGAPFMCPECQATGENADSECDANIVNKPCLEDDPVCVLLVSTRISSQKYRRRDCFSRAGFNYEKRLSDNLYLTYSMAMCDTSGCKAEIQPYMCPECRATGANAESECEANIQNKVCLFGNPVCALAVQYTGPETGRLRSCLPRSLYNKMENDCQKSGECSMSMCNTTGCKAAEPPRPFFCPVCEGYGQNATSECDANIDIMLCKKEDPVCVLQVTTAKVPESRTMRGCLSRKEFKPLEKMCKDTGYCKMAKCSSSGCTATVGSALQLE